MLFIFIFSSCKNNDINDKNAIEFINEWLSLRYNEVSYENIKEKLSLQESYYLKNMQDNSTFVGNEDEIIEYFTKYMLSAKIIYSEEIEIIKNSAKEFIYVCNLIVLYVSDNPSNDHYIEYNLKILLENNNDYKIKDIKIKIGDKNFLNGHDLHVSSEGVFLVYDNDDNCVDHTH